MLEVFASAIAELTWFYSSADAAFDIHGQSTDGGGGHVFDQAAAGRMHGNRLEDRWRNQLRRRELLAATLTQASQVKATLDDVFQPYGAASVELDAYFTLGGLRLFRLATKTSFAIETFRKKAASALTPREWHTRHRAILDSRDGCDCPAELPSEERCSKQLIRCAGTLLIRDKRLKGLEAKPQEYTLIDWFEGYRKPIEEKVASTLHGQIDLLRSFRDVLDKPEIGPLRTVLGEATRTASFALQVYEEYRRERVRSESSAGDERREEELDDLAKTLRVEGRW